MGQWYGGKGGWREERWERRRKRLSLVNLSYLLSFFDTENRLNRRGNYILPVST